MNPDSVQPAYEVVAALASRHATVNGCQVPRRESISSHGLRKWTTLTRKPVVYFLSSQAHSPTLGVFLKPRGSSGAITRSAQLRPPQPARGPPWGALWGPPWGPHRPRWGPHRGPGVFLSSRGRRTRRGFLNCKHVKFILNGAPSLYHAWPRTSDHGRDTCQPHTAHTLSLTEDV